ncbi:hypothetical protein Pelo_19631 [Pelomyxa schiedti]|nr:hypothetical protein Pelo_19631 [Pelomyxa schiedti]
MPITRTSARRSAVGVVDSGYQKYPLQPRPQPHIMGCLEDDDDDDIQQGLEQSAALIDHLESHVSKYDEAAQEFLDNMEFLDSNVLGTTPTHNDEDYENGATDINGNETENLTGTADGEDYNNNEDQPTGGVTENEAPGMSSF